MPVTTRSKSKNILLNQEEAPRARVPMPSRVPTPARVPIPVRVPSKSIFANEAQHVINAWNALYEMFVNTSFASIPPCFFKILAASMIREILTAQNLPRMVRIKYIQNRIIPIAIKAKEKLLESSSLAVPNVTCKMRELANEGMISAYLCMRYYDPESDLTEKPCVSVDFDEELTPQVAAIYKPLYALHSDRIFELFNVKHINFNI